MSSAPSPVASGPPNDAVDLRSLLRGLSGAATADGRSPAPWVEETDLDAVQTGETTLPVLDADASQRVCLEAAARGHSFAVLGAPGTGKRQTIANLIADGLGHGKTILFVSPRTTCLKEVYRRLQQAGLAGCCVSPDAGAAEVADELSRSAQGHRPAGAAPALDESRKLAELRDHLNRYARALHEVRQPLQRTAWSVFGELARLHDVPALQLGLPLTSKETDASVNAVPVLEVPPSWLEEARHTLERLQQLWPIGADKDHPWRGFKAERYTAQLRDDVIALVDRALNRLERLQTVAERYADQLGTRGPLALLVQIGELLATRPPQAPAAWLRDKDLTQLTDDLEHCSAQYQRLGQARAPLTERYGPDIFRLPPDTAKEVEQVWRAAAPLLAAGDSKGVGLLSHQQQLRGWAADTQKRVPGWLSDARTVEKWLAVPLPAAVGHVAGVPHADKDPSVHALRLLLRLANLCQADNPPERQWVHSAKSLEEARALIAANKPAFAAYRERCTRLRATYTEQFFELDLVRIAAGFAGPYQSWLRFFSRQYRRDRRAIARRSHAYATPATIADDVAVGRDVLVEKQRLQAESEGRRGVLGRYEQGLDSDLEAADRAARVAGEAVEVVQQLGCTMLPARLVDVLCSGSPAPEKVQAAAKRLHESLGTWLHATQELKDVLPMDALPGTGTKLEDSGLSALTHYARDLQASLNRFAALADPVLAHAPQRPSDAVTLVDDLRRAEELQAFEAAQEAEGQKWRGRLGPGFQGVTTDWDALRKGLSWARRVRERFRGAVLPEKLVQIASGQTPAPPTTDLRHAQEQFDQALHGLEHRFDAAAIVLDGKRLAEHPPDTIKQRLASLRDRAGELADWIEYRHLPERFAHLGLGTFWDDVHAGSVRREQLLDIFMKSFWTAWLEALGQQDPSLGTFERSKHEAILTEFGALDRRLLEENAGRVVRAAAGRRYMSVSIQQLEVLPPDMTFDLVVLDEGSQLGMEEAAAVMERGRQAVIVGDDQWPCARLAQADEKSILEAWLQAQVPHCRLRCHYRSRHESLIAFANRHFYEDRLLTFPAARAEQPALGVSFQYIADYRKQAEATADLVFEHLRDTPDKTLGVIALGEAHKRAIEDAIAHRLGAQPELEKLFQDNTGFFISDVGRIEKDERDVVLFCIGPGGDSLDELCGDVGLLDQASGPCWLNMAATQAREKLVVVSSVRAGDLDAAGEVAGLKLLQHFLEYAEGGGPAEEPPEAALLSADIAQVLQQHGYRTLAPVGHAPYTLDLGVLGPDDANGFVLGIQCDGPSYVVATTARDRERLWPDVLRQLGWRLHRIWAPAWVQRRQEEIDRLLRAADEAVHHRRT